MTAQEVIYALKGFYKVPPNTPVVIIKDDEQFEIKNVSTLNVQTVKISQQ